MCLLLGWWWQRNATTEIQFGKETQSKTFCRIHEFDRTSSWSSKCTDNTKSRTIENSFAAGTSTNWIWLRHGRFRFQLEVKYYYLSSTDWKHNIFYQRSNFFFCCGGQQTFYFLVIFGSCQMNSVEKWILNLSLEMKISCFFSVTFRVWQSWMTCWSLFAWYGLAKFMHFCSQHKSVLLSVCRKTVVFFFDLEAINGCLHRIRYDSWRHHSCMWRIFSCKVP